MTPLMCAAEFKKLPVVEYLLELKADVNARLSAMAGSMFLHSAAAVLFSFVCICSHVFVM